MITHRDVIQAFKYSRSRSYDERTNCERTNAKLYKPTHNMIYQESREQRHQATFPSVVSFNQNRARLTRYQEKCMLTHSSTSSLLTRLVAYQNTEHSRPIVAHNDSRHCPFVTQPPNETNAIHKHKQLLKHDNNSVKQL